MDRKGSTSTAVERMKALEDYFAASSPADYVGSDGSDPEHGPWARWCAGEVREVPAEFALFLWWHFCDALGCFIFPSGKGQYPERYMGQAAGTVSLASKEALAVELADHLRALSVLRSRPLDLATRFEEGDFFGSEEFATYSPIRIATAYTLWAIDQGVLGLLSGNAVKAATGFAYALSALELAHSYQQQVQMGDAVTLQSLRSMMARNGAKARHSADPKQAEKTFVKECWTVWRKEPTRYASKAAFARDMLSKCSHLESAKQIEDWCRDWAKELM